MATRVGFIGLGNIGKPMAINVAKAGFDLMVYDLRSEPMRELTTLGAKAARSSDEIGAHGEIIEVVVVDDAQVETALLGEGGVLSGAARGSIIALHSTVHPRTVRRLAEQAAAKGVTLIDAGVSGCERGAIAKLICYMVGGERAAFEKCRPVFATSGMNIFHLGDLGSGAVTKLAHNLNNAELAGENLSYLDLADAMLWNANLKGTNLRGANLDNAFLQSSDLTAATLTEASLKGADLSNSFGLTQNQIESALGDKSTILPLDIVKRESWQQLPTRP